MTPRETTAPVMTNGALLTIALFAAALAGLTETALLAVAGYGLGRFTHLNPHFAYLSPLWYMAAVLTVTGPMLLLGRRLSQRTRIAIAILPIVLVGSLGVLFLYVRLSKWAALALAIGVALQVTRIVVAHAPLVHAVARRGLPAVALVIAAIVVALHAPPMMAERTALERIAADGAKPNVLFIIWDTVRAASLSVHGYGRPTTPTLEQLSAQGVVFDRAFSIAPWTLPSHASLFTGLSARELSADWRVPLGDGPPTLAELFAGSGYATGGFVANYFYCSRESGLDRGFQHYAVYPAPSIAQFVLGSSVSRAFFNHSSLRRSFGLDDKPGRKEASGVNAEFVHWLDRVDGRPFFAFLNYFDAHAPYLPPAPWDTMFGPLLPGRDPSMQEGRAFTRRELQAEIDGYDGGIRSLDDHLGLLLEELEARGLLDNTIVVVTSDHGEEFGEHGFFTHGNTLYERSLHVPLLIRAPSRAPSGARIADWISTRDVAATIASMAGLEPRVGGRSLERFWTAEPASGVAGKSTAAIDTIAARVSHASGHPPEYPVSLGDMESILASPYQYIRRGDGEEYLFDLSDSASALINLAGRRESALTLRRFSDHLAQLGTRLARADSQPSREPIGGPARDPGTRE